VWYRRPFLISGILFLQFLIGWFNNKNIFCIFIKAFFLFFIPGGFFLFFYRKKKISLVEFLLKSFSISFVYILFSTFLIKLFWGPLTVIKICIFNFLFFITFLIFFYKTKLKSIYVSKRDVRILSVSIVFTVFLISYFKNYLFTSLENAGYKFYLNSVSFPKKNEYEPIYIFGKQWEKRRKVYFLEKGRKGNIYFIDILGKKKFIEVKLAIKGRIGSKVRISWGGSLLGEYLIPCQEMGEYFKDYIKYSKEYGVIFLKFKLQRKNRANVLEVKTFGTDIYCEVLNKKKKINTFFVYFPRMFDIIEVFKNSELFLESNRYIAWQPPLHYYFGGIGFCFFGKNFKGLSLVFIGELFFILLTLIMLIERQDFLTSSEEKYILSYWNSFGQNIFLIGINIFSCIILFFYLRDYIFSSTFIFGDTLYTLSFLLFLYFLLSKNYFWSGIWMTFTSLVRFPGYILCSLFLLFFLLFFNKYIKPEEIKIIKKIFLFSFMIMIIFNVVYPSFLHGFSSWIYALYFENIGEEHFGKNYTFSLNHIFVFIFQILRYTFFIPLLTLFRRDRISNFLILSSIPYTLILASVKHHQIYYMFPLISVGLVSGIREIQKLVRINNNE